MFLAFAFASASLVSAQCSAPAYPSESCFPDPFYTYAPNYDLNGCDELETPISGILKSPEATLPLIMTPEASAMNVIASGSILLIDGCSVSYFQ